MQRRISSRLRPIRKVIYIPEELALRLEKLSEKEQKSLSLLIYEVLIEKYPPERKKRVK